MEIKKMTGMTKRRQIQQAGKLMFIWVVAASVIVALCVVAAQFMYRQAAFNTTIVNEKTKARNTLDDNIDLADELKDEVNKLIANQELAKVKAQETDSNLKVVLDALPTEDDATAFATSLQSAILNRSGVTIETMTTGMSGTSAAITNDAAPVQTQTTVGEIPFSFVASGSFDQVKQMLADMEKTIRPIDFKKIIVRGSDNNLRVTVDGSSYYLPAKTVNVTSKTVRP